MFQATFADRLPGVHPAQLCRTSCRGVRPLRAHRWDFRPGAPFQRPRRSPGLHARSSGRFPYHVHGTRRQGERRERGDKMSKQPRSFSVLGGDKGKLEIVGVFCWLPLSAFVAFFFFCSLSVSFSSFFLSGGRTGGRSGGLSQSLVVGACVLALRSVCWNRRGCFCCPKGPPVWAGALWHRSGNDALQVRAPL